MPRRGTAHNAHRARNPTVKGQSAPEEKSPPRTEPPLGVGGRLEAGRSLAAQRPGVVLADVAAGQLAHAVDDTPMWELSACASGRAAPSLHPHTPASECEFRRMTAEGSHPLPGQPWQRHGEEVWAPVCAGALSPAPQRRGRLRKRAPKMLLRPPRPLRAKARFRLWEKKNTASS